MRATMAADSLVTTAAAENAAVEWLDGKRLVAALAEPSPEKVLRARIGRAIWPRSAIRCPKRRDVPRDSGEHTSILERYETLTIIVPESEAKQPPRVAESERRDVVKQRVLVVAPSSA